jgi:hypothetical protein
VSIERVKVESQQELEQMITNEINQIEKDLNVICNNIPINDRTTLDILCHDNNGQLVILQINVDEDDTMLLQGIQSIDYVNKFKSFLKATYNKHKIDDQEEPRLVLIAPSFSDAIRHAVESMKGMRIDLYEWEYLKIGDHKGLRLQPIFTWSQTQRPREDKEPKPLQKKNESKQDLKSIKKKEPALADEKKEEPTPDLKPEPPAPEPEPREQDFPIWPTEPVEKPREEKEETFKPKKEEPQKRKLKLF